MPEESFLDNTVHPIRIPTPFAVGDVYSYLITDEKNVLVDTGHKEEQAYERVNVALKKKGLEKGDIDEIWLTHGHPDHFGQAARIVDESDAVVYGHRKERANFACNDDRELFAKFFNMHSIPSEQIHLMVSQLDWLQQYQEAIEPQWVEDGDTLTSGGLSFEVKHTPGHAPGHLVFRERSGLIFGGDLLLEHISTNALINFDPDTGKRNRSLLQYRESLEGIRNQKGEVLPGHGKFVSNIRATADHHLTEHENRYKRILEMLSKTDYSLFELAVKTFPDALKKGGSFLVLSEVLGYLDWGLADGTIEKEEDNSRIRFRKA